MLSYELTKLGELVDLSDFKTTKQFSSQLNHRLFEIQNEIKSIQSAFIQTVFSNPDERFVQNYVQYHQQAIIRLLDQTHILSEASNSTLSQAYQQCYQALEPALKFIEDHFSKYFDLSVTVPHAYRDITIREFVTEIEELKMHLSRFAVDERLLNFILYPFEKYVRNVDGYELTFAKSIYLKSLMSGLLKLHGQSPSIAFYDPVLVALVYYNFNSNQVFGYMSNAIVADYQLCETLSEQLERLAWHKKSMRQLLEKPSMQYKYGRRSLKCTLIEWLEDEIEYLNRKHQLTLNLPGSNVRTLQNDFKINSRFSVAQLAYFIRMLVDLGIIQNKNQKKVLSFMASFTRTKRVEDISPESLRSKYYQVEQSTKDAMKDTVIQMLNYVRTK